MQGLVILDLTRVLAGPWATMQLADQGATVWKVEPPEGDETRGFGPLVDGVSTYFSALNRNKQAITLDLRTEAGKSVLLRLVDRADVLIENFRPGVAERLGFGWEVVHARNPRLVYVAIHAFGDGDGDPSAPHVGRPGYDIVLQAMGGGAAITGLPGGPPLKNGTSVADTHAGLLATQAVLFALLHRERTGEAQKIVVNMMAAQAAALTYHVTRYTVAGQAEVQRGNAHAGLCPYDLYPCADGWLAVACGNDTMWTRVARVLELPTPPEWATNVGRVADRQRVDAAVKAALATRTVADADAALNAAGVPAGPVLGIPEVIAHPAVPMLQIPHPTFGTLRVQGPALRTATAREDHAPPPTPDQDRDALLDAAGFSLEERASLAAQGAFGASKPA